MCVCLCIGACGGVHQSVRGAKRRGGSHRTQQLARHRRPPHCRSVRGAAVARREVFTCDARASSGFCTPRSAACACMKGGEESSCRRGGVGGYRHLVGIFLSGSHGRVSTCGSGVLRCGSGVSMCGSGVLANSGVSNNLSMQDEVIFGCMYQIRRLIRNLSILVPYTRVDACTNYACTHSCTALFLRVPAPPATINTCACPKCTPNKSKQQHPRVR